jgi:hypothetical protein
VRPFFGLPSFSALNRCILGIRLANLKPQGVGAMNVECGGSLIEMRARVGPLPEDMATLPEGQPGRDAGRIADEVIT